ncbi:mannose 6-phosphate receptor domain-containing protein [Auricularia subglabra TFB-10046 SS5]|nr:mannose 6-phosphate receptor domain-containing protein [Auricularia subglabra TFB-10046 SS5]
MVAARTALSLALAAAASAARAADDACTLEHKGLRYDLRPLQSKKDYELVSPWTGVQKYKLNVCGPVRSEIWNQRGQEDKIGGFWRGKDSDKSMGMPNGTLAFVEGAPVMLMTGGSDCSGGNGLKSSTAIRFICDGSAGVGTPKLLAQLPPDDDKTCSFFIEWKTSAACPSNASSLGGMLIMFISIFGIAFIAYLAAAVVYNYYVLQLRGIDILPSIPISSLFALPALCLSFFRRDSRPAPASSGFRRGIPRSWQGGGSGRSGYVGLPTDDEEARQPLAGGGSEGPFTLDDDEIDERDLRGPEPVQAHANGLARGGSGMGGNGVIRL